MKKSDFNYPALAGWTVFCLIFIICACIALSVYGVATDEITGEYAAKIVVSADTDGETLGELEGIDEVVAVILEEERLAAEQKSITMSFVGDCMLATMLGSTAPGTFNALANSVDPEYFFEGMAEYFLSDDWTVANCENVFSDSALSPVSKNHDPAYWYISKADNAKIFTVGGIDIVSFANNHANDYGTQGRTDTIAALEAANVEWGDNDKPLILEKHGVKIALLCTTMYYSGYETTINNWIKSVKDETDYIIIYYHGGTERQHYPDPWRVNAAKSMIDAGADLILGNHPHVLQPMEEYNGGFIVHSLGNFLFGGSSRPENRTIIFQLTLQIQQNQILSKQYSITPCYVYTDPWKPAIITNPAEIEKVTNFMNGTEDTPM